MSLGFFNCWTKSIPLATKQAPGKPANGFRFNEFTGETDIAGIPNQDASHEAPVE